jgi:hypothetical protein
MCSVYTLPRLAVQECYQKQPAESVHIKSLTKQRYIKTTIYSVVNYMQPKLHYLKQNQTANESSSQTNKYGKHDHLGKNDSL